ncbi:MAG TPA: xanthine dehydrogenase family protein molybdopterin-binding subunit [Alphaproteobacteria bacterium]|nr:xanthine dehydrogenase family protein molybdopterin-binding subunit [Alphaproteobacteria bacterium]
MADGDKISMMRREDERLVTGRGHYTADLKMEGLLHAVLVRSPYASALVRSVDCEAARAAPGVVAVYTAADLAADGLKPFPSGMELLRPDGGKSPNTPQPVLVGDRVRHVGEPVAMIIAESRAEAVDAIDLVSVDYEELPAVSSFEMALAPGAPVIWETAPDNIAFLWKKNEIAAVDSVLAKAAHVARIDTPISRVSAAPMEPRNAVGAVASDGRLTLYVSNQKPYFVRSALARWLGLPEDQVRVIAGDVGGSFGMKIALHVEEAAVIWAARKLGRPVRWIADRTEAFLADEHGRDVYVRAELGLDANGRFLGLKANFFVNLGAYFSAMSCGLFGNVGGIAGVYRIGAIAGEIRGFFTNRQPTAPYRGAGRPEATFTIERLIDLAAREMGIDPFELRRRNLIPPEAMPYDTGFTFTYDCGDFAANMAAAAKLADRDGFAARRAEAAKHGKLRGLGIANPIEVAGGPYTRPERDNVRLRAHSNGTVTLEAGMMSVGQGLETVLSQIAADRLGVPIERIHFVQGDTDLLPFGHGNGGSSGVAVGGTTVLQAIDSMGENGRPLAAALLGTEADRVSFTNGQFSAEGRSLSLAEVARAAEERGQTGLEGFADFRPEKVTYPNGCHICEVEIDPDTGAVEIVRYSVAEDIGRVLNPMLAQGQLHGGIAQGIGQALLEEIIFDPDSAQLLTASFMDYAMPRSDDVPRLNIEALCVPTAVNPLGAKGVGEAGTVGSLAATMNAVCDALGAVGIAHIAMPATPARIWEAIRKARG